VECSSLLEPSHVRNTLTLKIQIAIAKFFDGEEPDPLAEAQAALAASTASRPARRGEVLQNGSPYAQPAASSSNSDPAPRIVPQNENQLAYRPPFILSIFFAPLNLLYRLFAGSFGLIAYLFPFLPRLFANVSQRSQGTRRNTSGRRPLNPKDTAARFIREFEEEYGNHSLPFLENGYAQSLDIAKRDLKYLLVVLLSPEHDDTSPWVSETLLSQHVLSFINDPSNNIILWGGNVQDSEAYQVANALNCTKFPYAALIVHTPRVASTAMSVVGRISGTMTPSSFVATLQTAMNQNAAALDAARATRAEQQAARNLREEQNSAYERSLAQDRERARRKREAEANRHRAEKEALEKIAAEEKRARDLEQWKDWRAQSLPQEPSGDMKDAIRISIRMLSGERVVRRFAPEADLEELFAFIECYEILKQQHEAGPKNAKKPADFEHKYSFRLVSPLPRTVYEVDAGGSIGEKIGRSGNLLVEPIDDEDSEEDEESA
jgi:FAS-associated factor 2